MAESNLPKTNLTEEELWNGLQVFNNHLKGKTYSKQVSDIITSYSSTVTSLQHNFEELWIEFSDIHKEVNHLWEMIYDENLYCGSFVIKKWLEDVEMLQDKMLEIREEVAKCLKNKDRAELKYKYLLKIAEEMSK